MQRGSVLGFSFLLILLAQARIPGAVTSLSASGHGDVTYRTGATYWALVAMLIAILGLRLTFGSRLATRPAGVFTVCLICGLGLVSALWSPNPVRSLGEGGLLLVVGLLGLYGGRLLGRGGVAGVLYLSAAVVLALSLLYIVLTPRIGTMYSFSTPLWRGAFANINDLGRWASLGALLAFAVVLFRRRARRMVAGALCVGSLYVALRTGSSQAVVVFVVSATLLATAPLLGSREKRNSGPVVLLGIAAAMLLAIALTFWSQIFAFLGADPTLNARTDLWRAIVVPIWQRPVVGYGLGGYWRSDRPWDDGVVSAAGFLPSHAHNSLLDWMLQLGIVGAVVLIAFSILALKAALSNFMREPGVATASLASAMLFVCIYGLTATMVLGPRMEWWLVSCLVLGASGELRAASSGRREIVKLARPRSAA